MVDRVTLILAGGKATRFQIKNTPWNDKALAKIDGKPLLLHVIENLKNCVDKIVICVNNKQRIDLYKKSLDNHTVENLEFVVDQECVRVKGPLLAITSGLQAVEAKYFLVVPTDMPFIQPEVANYLINACDGYEVTVPMWPDGTVETLFTVLEKESCIETTKTLCTLGKSNADTIFRAAAKLHLVSPIKKISNLDPELRSFININSQNDLERPKTRSTEGAVMQDIYFDRGKLPIELLCQLRAGQEKLCEGKLMDALTVFANCACRFETSNFFFWAAVSQEKLGETQVKLSNKTIAKQTYARAVYNYRKEAEVYTEKGCGLLAERALADKDFCEEKIRN